MGHKTPARSKHLLWVIAATIGVGAILRLWQFSAGGSLWLDELAVVRNIIHLPLVRLLTSPLEYDQMAPVGFLATGRLLSLVIRDQDWVFRLEPLASSLLTLPLLYLLARRAVRPVPAVLATALVCLSPHMVELGSTAKQYAGDVFVSTALVYGALRIMAGEADEPARLFRLGLLGGLLLFFSFPGVLVAFGLTVVVVGRWIHERKRDFWPRVLALGAPLGGCAALASAIALRVRSPGTAAYMAEYWASGFPPSLVPGPRWLWRHFLAVYQGAFLGGGDVRWATILLSFGIIGAVALTVERKATALVVIAPLVVALMAAIAHFYPLADRLAFFLTPSLAVLVVAGAGVLVRLGKQAIGSAATAAYAFPILGTCVALFLTPLPIVREDMRPLMREVAAEWSPGDAVYSYYAANQAVDYYGERFGITEAAWDAGTCHRGDPRAYLSELDHYRGAPRVWVLFTHVLPLYGEADAILGYLHTIGTERTEISTRDYTSAYLFDLSDPSLLSRATAQTYELGPAVPVNRRNGCGGGPQAKWRRPELSARE